MYIKIKMNNYEDIAKSVGGYIKPEDVRSVETEGRIDTGATHLLIPEKLFKDLGLREIDETKVKYADGRVEKKKIASVVEVEIKGRRTSTEPIVEVDGSEILIGNPIFEALDFMINPVTGEVFPNPASPGMPLAEAL